MVGPVPGRFADADSHRRCLGKRSSGPVVGNSLSQVWYTSAVAVLESRHDAAVAYFDNCVRDCFAKKFQSSSGRWDLEALKVALSTELGGRIANGMCC